VNTRQIAKKLLTLLRRRGGAALAALPQQIQHHARTGELPPDPLARTHLELTEATTAAMDASVGGDGHGRACEAYAEALERWEQARKENGL